MTIDEDTPEEKKRGIDMAFISGYNYSWIQEKILMQDVIINHFSDFLKILSEKTPVKFREDGKEDFLMMLRVDSITTTVKYCEDLAAISSAFGKGHFEINDTLKRYKVSDVKQFFDKISSANTDYLQKVLAYGDVEGRCVDHKEEFLTSYSRARQYYAETKKFYNSNLDLYNCYKHGLRLMPVIADEATPFLMKFPTLKNKEFEFEGFSNDEIKAEYKKALRICGIIVTLLQVIFKNHKEWYSPEHKSSYVCEVV
jgi:hypothetical protein